MEPSASSEFIAARRRRVIFLSITAAFALGILYAFREVLAPFAVALVVAYVFAPVVERMERIRRAISQIRVVLDNTPPGGWAAQAELINDGPAVAGGTVLTASIGVASWPEDHAETVEALVYRADSRLLSAKATGRNRVVSSAGVTDEFAILSAARA